MGKFKEEFDNRFRFQFRATPKPGDEGVKRFRKHFLDIVFCCGFLLNGNEFNETFRNIIFAASDALSSFSGNKNPRIRPALPGHQQTTRWYS